MKKVSMVFILLATLVFTTFAYTYEGSEVKNPHTARIYFPQNLQQPNPQCVDIFTKLVKTSNYGFESYKGNKDIQWVKEHISFEFDAWDNDKILVRLFFDWVDKDSKEFQGTGTITWLIYDIKTQILKDSVQEKDLAINANLANKLENCLSYCNFLQTLALQEQYKDENVIFLMQSEIIGSHAKDRAYFYSVPNKKCKIDDLFFNPKR